jgi:hypothetical protein
MHNPNKSFRQKKYGKVSSNMLSFQQLKAIKGIQSKTGLNVNQLYGEVYPMRKEKHNYTNLDVEEAADIVAYFHRHMKDYEVII